MSPQTTATNKRIYFVSDIHLGGGTPEEARRREERFVQWLDEVGQDAEAIVLLGDIFDFWYEYKRVVPKGFVRTLAKFAELSQRGVRMVFFSGNHDMWVRNYFQTECGMEVYTEPQLLDLFGQHIYMGHGDNMGVGKEPRLLNRIFRSTCIRWLFSHLVHPDWAMKFGLWWSGKSRKSHIDERSDETAEQICKRLTDPLIGFARQYATRHSVDHFIFGHLHFPREFKEGTLHVIHLGGWEKYPSYAVLDQQGLFTLEMIER